MQRRRDAQSGFTIVELLVTLSIMTLLFLAIMPKFWNFFNTYQLDAQARDLVQVLRLAQSKATQSEDHMTWSVHLTTGTGGAFTLFRGSVYASRDTDYDEVHTLPSSLSLSYTVPDTDVTFSKIEGATSDTGTITLSWPDGGLSWVVDINALGRVDLQ